jgi:Xaa-Pro aminopeptidase
MPAFFQTFDSLSSPEKAAQRMGQLQKRLKEEGLDGLIVPHTDEFQSEYVPPCAQRLTWLTGFAGSAGMALILQDQALLFVDGRYTLQARQDLDGSIITVIASHETSLNTWLTENLKQGSRIGFDPSLHTHEQIKKTRAIIEASQGLLLPVSGLIDTLWTDRPAPPRSLVREHPQTKAGETREVKWERIRQIMKANALLISDPHNLAWAFNIRGNDVAHTPLILAYGLIPARGKPVLFVEEDRLSPHTCQHFKNTIICEPASRLQHHLSAMGCLQLDQATASCALNEMAAAACDKVMLEPDPITKLKAIKNAAEIEGTRAAHMRDGAALTRFLAWFSHQTTLTEIDAVEALEGFREETGMLKDISFPTIAGSGPNGAIVHYRVTTRTNREIGSNELFLIDSGAQYEDGTTDVTRTLCRGTPSPAMKYHYTLVLKGHIAVARAIFPEKTSGTALDGFARRPLWEAGLDYDHGTGHGVGSYLSVHEGPQRISKTGSVALEPGMILSNEPGYYREGFYGIRLENLVLVEPREIEGAEKKMLGFETLTLAPFARNLIEISLLTEDEKLWLNEYHERVYKTLSPLLDQPTALWLFEATRPLSS